MFNRYRSSSLSFVLLIAVLLPAQAQEPGSKKDLRVQVQLKNGSTFRGIAVSGRLIETRNRGLYRVAPDKSSRKCGIRLWYYRDQNGFLFIKHRNITKMTVEGEVSAKDLNALRSALSEASKSRRRKVESDGLRKLGEGEDGLSESEKKLLAEFPPSKGWGPERYGEIHHARVVGGKKPSAAEERFLKVYEEWSKAWRKSRAGTRQTPKKAGPREPKRILPKTPPPGPNPKKRGRLGGIGLGGR